MHRAVIQSIARYIHIYLSESSKREISSARGKSDSNNVKVWLARCLNNARGHEMGINLINHLHWRLYDVKIITHIWFFSSLSSRVCCVSLKLLHLLHTEYHPSSLSLCSANNTAQTTYLVLLLCAVKLLAPLHSTHNSSSWSSTSTYRVNVHNGKQKHSK